MAGFPETILNCLCLNMVSMFLFSAFKPETDDDRDIVEQVCTRRPRIL